MKATKLLLAAGTALPILALIPGLTATARELAASHPLIVAQLLPSEGPGRGGSDGGGEQRARGGRGAQEAPEGEERPRQRGAQERGSTDQAEEQRRGRGAKDRQERVQERARGAEERIQERAQGAQERVQERAQERQQRIQERTQGAQERVQERAQERQERIQDRAGAQERLQERTQDRTQGAQERIQDRGQQRLDRLQERAQDRQDSIQQRGQERVQERVQERQDRLQQREERALDKAAQDKAAQEKAAQDKAAQDKAAQDKAAQDKAAQEKAAQDRAAQERAKAAQDKAAQDKAAQDKAAQDKAAQDKAAQDKAAQERALDRQERLQPREERAQDRQERLQRREERAQERQDPERMRREERFAPGIATGERRDVRVDELRSLRRERVEEGGRRIVIEEPGDRRIIREGNRTVIIHDETDRFRRVYGGADVRVERRGGQEITIVRRPNGVEIITVRDEYGNLIRRVRREPGRGEVVLIENVVHDRPRRTIVEEIVELPPPVIRIPREKYVVEVERASQEDIYEAFTAPPVERIDRSYTLEEIRRSPSLRERVRRVDVDTVTFDFGSWTLSPDQIGALTGVAQAMLRAIERNPDEIFLIEGHTDAVGNEVDNLSLSDRRAETVATVLSERFQVPAENLTTQGYGEQYLKINTQEPERENRRVTIRRITPLLKGQESAAR